jgi:hypothetical protein
MLRCTAFLCIALFFSRTGLTAQATPSAPPSGGADDGAGGGTEPAAFIFPVHIPLQTAADGRILWRPDWPAGIPVDAFSPLNADGLDAGGSVTLSGGGFRLSARRGEHGELTMFPVFLNGVFYQFNASFDTDGKISGLALDGENPVEIEFLAFENADGEPSLARISEGGAWFFASILCQDGLTLETWYDQDGAPLAVFTTRFDEGLPKFYGSVFNSSGGESAENTADEAAGMLAYHDSMGNITRLETGNEVFEALYDGEGPRYWEQTGSGSFSLQWDEAGRLVRITGLSPDGAPLDYRYEYTVDGRGLWTERREFRMTAELGVLIPVPGEVFRRALEYR